MTINKRYDTKLGIVPCSFDEVRHRIKKVYGKKEARDEGVIELNNDLEEYIFLDYALKRGGEKIRFYAIVIASEVLPYLHDSAKIIATGYGDFFIATGYGECIKISPVRTAFNSKSRDEDDF